MAACASVERTGDRHFFLSASWPTVAANHTLGGTMIALRAAILCVVSLAAFGAAAADLPRAEPAAVGLSAEGLGRLEAVLRADIANRVIPGAVLLVARHGKVAYFERRR